MNPIEGWRLGLFFNPKKKAIFFKDKKKHPMLLTQDGSSVRDGKPRRIKRKDGDAQQVKEINKTENVIAMSDCNIKNQTLKLL